MTIKNLKYENTEFHNDLYNKVDSDLNNDYNYDLLNDSNMACILTCRNLSENDIHDNLQNNMPNDKCHST